MSARDFEVIQCFTSVATGLFENLRHLPRLALLPFLLTITITFVDRQLTGSPLPSLIAQVLDVIPHALFALVWLRLLLLGSSGPSLNPLPAYGPSEKQFYSAAIILIGLGVILIQVALTSFALHEMPGQMTGGGGDGTETMGGQPGMGGLGFFLFITATAYLVFTLAAFFVLPARAVGLQYSFRQSFQDTKGVKFKLFLAAMLVLVPAEIAGSLATTPFLLMSKALGADLPIIAGQAAVGYIIFALSAGVMAEAFKTVTGWTPGRNPTT